jgi:hypothetical protein
MSRTFHHGERRVRVREAQRKDPNLRKLARALIDLAQSQAEAEAEALHKQQVGKVVELRPDKSAGPKKDAA